MYLFSGNRLACKQLDAKMNLRFPITWFQLSISFGSCQNNSKKNEIGEAAVTHILMSSRLFLESSGKKHNRNNLPKASRKKLVN